MEDIVATHRMQTFKCSSNDVMSVLFMLAYAYPGYVPPPPPPLHRTADATAATADESVISDVSSVTGIYSGAAKTSSATSRLSDSDDAQSRRSDFESFMAALPIAMLESKCACALPEILLFTWESFVGNRDFQDTLYTDAIIANVMHNVRSARQRARVTRNDVFMLVWVLRARLAEGIRSSTCAIAVEDAQAIWDRMDESIEF